MNRGAFRRFCLSKGYSQKSVGAFLKALDFSWEIFEHQLRLSGESFFDHNLRIGKILVESKLSNETILAGILRGVEKEVTPSKVRELFGAAVADIVFSQNQLREIKSKNKSNSPEVLRKVLLVSLDDPRVIFVKLAAKLDNLRTLSVFPRKKQEFLAREVLEIYAPLGTRLGLEKIRRSLEEEAFKVLNPKKYSEIQDFLKSSSEDREKFVSDFLKKVKKLLKGKVSLVGIKGRDKHIYSIYKKMRDRGVRLNDQKDHFAVRIILKSEEDCYSVLGILHETFDSVDGTLKDYIKNSKPNGYKSIHTVLIFDEKKIEVQIRTKEMDDFAEEGAASHWAYKGLDSEEAFEKRTAWLRNVLNLEDLKKDKKLVESLKSDLFGNKFYAYTPQGKAILLPKGATVLDFAYLIHQEVGNTAIAGRINGKFSPLRAKIGDNDVVEVLTNKKQRPRKDWLKFVGSVKSRGFIRKWLKKNEGLIVRARYDFEKIDKSKEESFVESHDLKGINFSMAKCCAPLPGDSVVAVLKSSKNALVHREDCLKIQNVGSNVFPVVWKDSFNRSMNILARVNYRSGILADLLNTISRRGFTVTKTGAKLFKDGFAECSFEIVPRDPLEVEDLLNRLKKVSGVRKIYFD